MATDTRDLQKDIEAFRKSLREPQPPVYDEEEVRRRIQRDIEQG